MYNLPIEHLELIMQSLYISSGCDYVSYFKTFGKVTVLNVFTQYSTFISGMGNSGSLHQTKPANQQDGFLSFIRLIGTCYFKKLLSAFLANYGHSTPVQLYDRLTILYLHKKDIRHGCRKSDQQFLTEFQMRKIKCQHGLLCGVIGSDHAGSTRCGKGQLAVMFILLYHFQKTVDGSELTMTMRLIGKLQI